MTDLADGKYLSLTTFRADGTPVATPVWLVRNGAHLEVITDANSGKVKRLRVNPNVIVAPCTARGTVTGAPQQATAKLLDPAASAAVAKRIAKKYGLIGRMMLWWGARRSDQGGGQIGIAITISQ
jgi:PPOX class probable F420-dependent enzyme